MLESHQPMIIVMRTIVGFPATPGGIKLVGKRGCPLLPCEMPLLGELHRERECLDLPRLGKPIAGRGLAWQNLILSRELVIRVPGCGAKRKRAAGN